MTALATNLDLAITQLSEAVDLDEAVRIDAEVQNISILVVEALYAGDVADVGANRNKVERIYSGARYDKEGVKARNDTVVGQLRALVSLFAAGAKQARALPDAALVKRSRTVLKALLEADGSIDNQEIARLAGVAEETVARLLPALRDARLVSSRREWKRSLNELTEAGRAACATAGLQPKPAPRLAAVPTTKLLLEKVWSVDTPAIDVAAIATEMGITVNYDRNFPVSGRLTAKRGPLGTFFEIEVSSVEAPVRQRFTIAHELAHVVLHGDQLIAAGPGAVRHRGAGWDAEEVAANRMAAAILMPEILVLKELEKTKSAATLARQFKVSPEAMGKRLVELRLAA